MAYTDSTLTIVAVDSISLCCGFDTHGQFCQVTYYVEVAVTLQWQQSKVAKLLRLLTCRALYDCCTMPCNQVRIYCASNSHDFEPGPSLPFGARRSTPIHFEHSCDCCNPCFVPWEHA